MSLALDHDRFDHGAPLLSLVAGEGSAGHPYTHSAELNAGPGATRNLADVLHLLSLLHGPQPGLIEQVAERNLFADADPWLAQAAAGFAAERAYLAQLIVVAGPPPSTPGEADTVAALLAQRHALGTISASERLGCALGAVAGLLLDWEAIRAVLDTAAVRMGIGMAPSLLPGETTTMAVLGTLPPLPRIDRTIAFGARQLLVQHCGLWDLLETRAGARAELEAG